MRTNELPGIPVINDGGRCVGIVTETDLVLPDDDGDLHLPHYVNIFGGTVFLEPLRKCEGKIKKAFASTAADMMTEDPVTVEPYTSIDEAARHHPRHRPQPAAGGRARAPGRRGHPRRRARRPRLGLGADMPAARARAGQHRRDPGQLPHAERARGRRHRAVRGGQGRRLRPRRRHRRPRGAGRGVPSGWRWPPPPRRRSCAPQDIVVPILVMGALSPEEARPGAGQRRRRGGVDARVPGARSRPRRPRVHVKLDTGMGRLGTNDLDEARALVRAVDLDQDASLAGVMTHFATADEPGDDHFPRQLERFTAFAAEVRGDHPGVIAHAANSAATLRDPAAHFDMVRCGIAVYGIDPFQQDAGRPGPGARAGAAQLRGGGQAVRARRQRRLRAPLDRRAADLGGHAADRLRRRLAARADQRLRRADRRPPPPAGGHGEHGQRDRRPRPRHRRRGGRRRPC